MSSRNSIRWRKVDQDKLTNLVRQFNGKITRELKKDSDMMDYLPERLNIRELEKYAKQLSRYEYNKIFNRYKRFLKKDATKLVKSKGGAIATKWELQETRYQVQSVNYSRKKRLEEIGPQPEYGNMGSIEANSLRPKEIKFQQRTQSEWKAFVQATQKQASAFYDIEGWKRYQQNMVWSLRLNLGFPGEYLADLVENLSVDQYKVIFKHEDADLQIMFVYGPEDVVTVSETWATQFEERGGKVDWDKLRNYQSFYES